LSVIRTIARSDGFVPRSSGKTSISRETLSPYARDFFRTNAATPSSHRAASSPVLSFFITSEYRSSIERANRATAQVPETAHPRHVKAV